MQRSVIQGVVALLAFASSAHAQDGVEAAQAECEAGHYAAALAKYEQASNQGDAAAAARAGEMLVFSAVFAGQVPRDLSRAKSHLERASKAGNAVSGYLLQRLSHVPVQRAGADGVAVVATLEKR